jgi:hypothetical protein
VAIPGGSRARRISLQWSIFCMILSGAHRGHRASLATPLALDLSCFILNSAGFRVDAFSLGLTYGSGEPLSPVAEQYTVSYSQLKNCYCRHNYYDYIGPGGRTILIAVVARAQGSTTKPQLSRKNGTDEQRFGCYANGRRARVPGGTTPGARHARPSCYSRFSEEASTLPAARGTEQ